MNPFTLSCGGGEEHGPPCAEQQRHRHSVLVWWEAGPGRAGPGVLRECGAEYLHGSWAAHTFHLTRFRVTRYGTVLYDDRQGSGMTEARAGEARYLTTCTCAG